MGECLGDVGGKGEEETGGGLDETEMEGAAPERNGEYVTLAGYVVVGEIIEFLDESGNDIGSIVGMENPLEGRGEVGICDAPPLAPTKPNVRESDEAICERLSTDCSVEAAVANTAFLGGDEDKFCKAWLS